MKTQPIIIESRPKDLGGFSVRRVLPFAHQRMVGPFIFFDHMGPAEFPPGQGVNVRPHPHINLATVTYLFSGQIFHRDSLGSAQLIEPGAINWMTAGRGIVHSERTPSAIMSKSGSMNGIQLWVALPEEFEETTPTFKHYPSSSLPEFNLQGANFKLLLGRALDKSSPVKVFSDLFYLEVKVSAHTNFNFPTLERETAAYVVKGQIEVDGMTIPQFSMGVWTEVESLNFNASEDSHFMLLGGKTLGPRHIFWNFVSSSAERLEEAKREWQAGPYGSRFSPVPGDDQEFIPLPSE